MKMDICFGVDYNYLPHMATVIASILKNSLEDEEFTFHIIDGGIGDDNRNKILLLKEIKDFDIKFYTPDIGKYNEWFEKTDCKHHFSPAMFYRISIPSLIKVDRILYLDCDIIVNGSLRELFELNLEDYYAGVVIGSNKVGYFCSGLLLINTNLWIKNNIEEKCVEYYDKNYKTCFGDQDILNSVLKNKVKFLDEKWLYFSNETFNSFDPDLKDIVIIHYLGYYKPWQTKTEDLLLLYEYWKYFQYTPWFEEDIRGSFNTLLEIAINERNKQTKENKILKNFMYKIAWCIPIKNLRDKFKKKFCIKNMNVL